MTKLTSIQVLVQTADVANAGTDGDVYLGIDGREFHLNTSSDDFERDSSRTYILGQGANVLNDEENDPRNPSVELEQVDLYPVYIRFQPTNRDDRWKLLRVNVFLNGSVTQQYESFIDRDGGLWMGIRSTLFFYLVKHTE